MEQLLTVGLTYISNPTSILMFFFILMLTGKLVPKYQITWLKDDQKELQEANKLLLEELKRVARLLEGSNTYGTTYDSGGD